MNWPNAGPEWQAGSMERELHIGGSLSTRGACYMFALCIFVSSTNSKFFTEAEHPFVSELLNKVIKYRLVISESWTDNLLKIIP
jgi:hypothetical protein